MRNNCFIVTLRKNYYTFLSSFFSDFQGLVEVFRDHFCFAHNGHKIRIPIPSRDKMEMYVLINSRTCSSA